MKPCRPKIIGLTGGIATGKSTVSSILQKLGFKVIDADKIARDVVEKGKPAYREIIHTFGKDILDEYGDINRRKLADIIFENPFHREKLNRIVHPYVFVTIKDSIAESECEKIIFLDIPLLIEEMDKLKEHKIDIDEIWLVYVDERTQLDRLMKRDSISEEEALKRIRAQMPIEDKKKYATRIIDNRVDLERLKKQVEGIIDETI
ncbi:MAG: dephospho-CoA kinase [Tissierellia bacterium]|nr:dephospho-CoA kinase [Tissierellia bacterium]